MSHILQFQKKCHPACLHTQTVSNPNNLTNRYPYLAKIQNPPHATNPLTRICPAVFGSFGFLGSFALSHRMVLKAPSGRSRRNIQFEKIYRDNPWVEEKPRTPFARALRLHMTGEGKIRAALSGKGRGNLPFRLPSPLAPSQIFSFPNFYTGGGYVDQEIWQRASPFGLLRRSRIVVSSRSGACAYLWRLSSVSIVCHDRGKWKLLCSTVVLDSCR
jgi:hypothetical protein